MNTCFLLRPPPDVRVPRTSARPIGSRWASPEYENSACAMFEPISVLLEASSSSCEAPILDLGFISPPQRVTEPKSAQQDAGRRPHKRSVNGARDRCAEDCRARAGRECEHKRAAEVSNEMIV